MRYNEFREKVVSAFQELTSTGMTSSEIDCCCHLFGILAACLSVLDEIKDEDLFVMFFSGYAAAKENNPVKEVVSIPIPKKST